MRQAEGRRYQLLCEQDRFLSEGSSPNFRQHLRFNPISEVVWHTRLYYRAGRNRPSPFLPLRRRCLAWQDRGRELRRGPASCSGNWFPVAIPAISGAFPVVLEAARNLITLQGRPQACCVGPDTQAPGRGVNLDGQIVQPQRFNAGKFSHGALRRILGFKGCVQGILQGCQFGQFGIARIGCSFAEKFRQVKGEPAHAGIKPGMPQGVTLGDLGDGTNI
jgi:hypothetical protein